MQQPLGGGLHLLRSDAGRLRQVGAGDFVALGALQGGEDGAGVRRRLLPGVAHGPDVGHGAVDTGDIAVAIVATQIDAPEARHALDGVRRAVEQATEQIAHRAARSHFCLLPAARRLLLATTQLPAGGAGGSAWRASICCDGSRCRFWIVRPCGERR